MLSDLVATGLVRTGVAIGPLTTYKFGGPAAWFAEVNDMAELQQVVAARNATVPAPPIFVLGRGSNTVVSDRGFAGLVVRLAGDFAAVRLDGEEVVAGAAVSLPQLARFCAAGDRGGLEFYVGIPGSVGGAIVMNAGGHGSDTAEWLVAATVLDLDNGVVAAFDAAGLDLGYRHSRLGPNEVVLEARYRTRACEPGAAAAVMREISGWRREHQPGGTFNAGSVFKNPPGDAAGRIIDALGLKGTRCGAVAVSERHANFFVAGEGATAQQVFDLVAVVRRRVADATGIELEPEIRFLGDFGGPDDG
jgi:UDP-N-acetylmuramate dehydrogenase